MKYRELTPAEQEAYDVGYRVGSHQITITDIEWESENEHKIYRKGYWAGYKDRVRNNIHNVHNVNFVHTQAQCPQCLNCNSDNVIVNVIDNEIDNVIDNNSRNNTSKLSTTRVEQFTPPTLQQVLDYAQMQNSVAGMGGFACTQELAEQFWTHYESIGWRVGNENRTPITNWQSKLRNWAAKEKQQIPFASKESEKERKARENHEKLQKMLKGEQI